MSALRIVRTRRGPSGSLHEAVLVRAGWGAGHGRALSPTDRDRIGRVAHLAPAIGSYAGRAILDPSLWTVRRHSGRGGGPSNRRWAIAFAGTEQEARERFERAERAIRQGGIRLVSPAGVVAERHAPRVRSRW